MHIVYLDIISKHKLHYSDYYYTTLLYSDKDYERSVEWLVTTT